MLARIFGQDIELTPLDEVRGVYSCDLSSVGLGSDCVVRRQRLRASSKETFRTHNGMRQVVDYWMLQYRMADPSDRVQRQLSPDPPEDGSSTQGQVMPMFMSAGNGRSMDVMLWKGARYCTRADYLEGKRIAQANKAAWLHNRTHNSAMQQLAAEVASGVSAAIPAAIAAHAAHAAQQAAPSTSTSKAK